MSKLLNFSIIFLSLFTSCALAQSIFDQPSTAPATPSSTGSGSMNASDFKSAVSNMSQQTNSSLSQQAKQLYPKTQPAQAGAKGTVLPTPAGSEPAPSAVDNSFSVNSAAQKPPAGQPGAAPPASQPSDTYTGFGGSSKQQPAKKSTTPSSGNSGGWNINY